MQTVLSEHQPLNREVSKHNLLKERLLAAYPEDGVDDLADTLEGLTDLNEMIAAVIRSALVDEALQKGLKIRLSDMKERLNRHEHRSTKKRQIALEAMSETELKKVEEPDFTASARCGVPAVVPKVYLPNYREFYERRHFASGSGVCGKTLRLAGQEVAFGTDILLKARDVSDLVLHAELCSFLILSGLYSLVSKQG